MIWSAIFRRSEDRKGDRFLIYLPFSLGSLSEISCAVHGRAVDRLRRSNAGEGLLTVGFFLNMVETYEKGAVREYNKTKYILADTMQYSKCDRRPGLERKSWW